jgi:hypothetical protein
MDEYLQTTEAYLRVIQGILTKQQQGKAEILIDELYDKIREICEREKLSVLEMMHIILKANFIVLQACRNDIEDKKKKEN